MKKQTFNCTLTTDIVLTGNSATEGFQPALSYIPGAKFWGIVANQVFKNGVTEMQARLFSNAVRFGDARPLIKGEHPSLKVPLLWMTEKEKKVSESPVYLSHVITDNDRAEITKGDAQLKQMREGYFSPATHQLFMPEHNFYLKSAYDSEKRRAKEGQMFGYHVLPAGSTWQFEITANDESDLTDISKMLTGQRRVGRSRSAEFGLVDIQPTGDVETVEQFPMSATGPNRQKVLLYAESNLCFLNHLGQNVLVPDTAMLRDFGFPEGSTVCSRTRLRHRLYQSWNTKRFNRDMDRLIVEAGSVLIVNVPDGSPAFALPRFIGSYQNEGFGAILVNPDFLKSSGNKLEFHLEKNEDSGTGKKVFYTEGNEEGPQLKSILEKRLDRSRQMPGVDKLVNDFRNKCKMHFKGVSASQWGVLRNLAKGSSTDDILNKILFGFDSNKKNGFLYKGNSEGQWRSGREKLWEFLYGKDKDERTNAQNHSVTIRALLSRLASIMAKEAQLEQTQKEAAE